MAEVVAVGVPESALLDVVFLHGLDGDARRTWTGKGPSSFWPGWLAEDVDDVAVWSVGYEAWSTGWRGRAMPMQDRAVNLMAQLQNRGIGQRPLCFVTHSMGGLLAKEILLHAAEDRTEYATFARAARGVVFLGTPHTGSSLTTVVKALGVVYRATAAVKDLKRNSAHLRQLNDRYRDWADESGIRNLVFFEAYPTKGVRVVDEVSANPGLARVRPIPVDADHIDICKPLDRDALVYGQIKRFIVDILATVVDHELASNLMEHVPPPARLPERQLNPADVLIPADQATQQSYPMSDVRRVGSHLVNPQNLMHGRAEHQATLFDILTSTKVGFVEVYGRSQCGKTALVSSVLDRITDRGQQATGVPGIACVSASADGLSLASLVRILIELVDVEARAAVENVAGTAELPVKVIVERIVQALSGRFVVVLDHLDDVLDDNGNFTDPEIAEFIDCFLSARQESVLVVTSAIRAHVTVVAGRRRIDLESGLSTAEGVALLRELPDELDMTRTLSAEELTVAVERVGGVPGLILRIPVMLSEDPFAELQGKLAGIINEDPVRQVLELAYKRITDSQRVVLEALAIVGRAEPAQVLKAMAPEIDSTQLSAALNGLIRALLVVRGPDGLISVEAVDRDYFGRRLPSDGPRSAVDLHRRAAGYYARLHTPIPKWASLTELRTRLLEIDHRIASHDFEAAARVLTEWQDALVWKGGVRQVARYLTQLDGRVENRRLQVFLQLARAQCKMLLGPVEEASAHLESVMDDATQIGDVRTALNAQALLGESRRREGSLSDSIALLTAVRASGDESVIFDRAVHLALGLAYLYDGQHDQAARCAERLRAGGEDFRRPYEDLESLILVSQGRAAPALELARSAIARDSAENSVDGDGYFWNVAGMAYSLLGDTDEALSAFGQGLAVSDELGDLRPMALCALNRAFVRIAIGNLDEACADAEVAYGVLKYFGRIECDVAAALVSGLEGRDLSDRAAGRDALVACADVLPRSADIMPPDPLRTWARVLANQ